MGEILRLEWEYVSPVSHPDCYEGESPSVPACIIPDDYWSKVTKYSFREEMHKSLREQFNGLLYLMEKHELIRTVTLSRVNLNDDDWEEMARANGNNHSPT